VVSLYATSKSPHYPKVLFSFLKGQKQLMEGELEGFSQELAIAHWLEQQ